MENKAQKLSDEQLCRLCKLGDDAAMAELINRIMPLAAAKAQTYSHPDLNKDDLIQEGMLGFITAVNTYDEKKQASFKTYAGVCIHNRIFSLLRKTQSLKTIPREFISSIDDGEDFKDYSTDPQEIFSKDEDLKALGGFIENRLSELEKNVLKLKLQSRSYEEIAKRLSISVKSVDNAMNRIRRKLNEDK